MSTKDNAFLAWRRKYKLGQPEPADAEEARQEMNKILRLPREGIEILEVNTEAGFMVLQAGEAKIRSGFPLLPTGDAESSADEVISALYAEREPENDLPF